MARKNVFDLLVELTRRSLVKEGIAITPRLEEVLLDVTAERDGSLGRLPGEIARTAREQLYPPSFFARDTRLVAEGLCGSHIFYIDSRTGLGYGGLITSTAAYAPDPKGKDKATARGAVGKIGSWSTRGNDVIIIGSYEQDIGGTVAIWGISTPRERLNMGQTGEILRVRNCEGTIIGVNAPWILLPRDPSLEMVGDLYVRSTGRQKGSSASYELKAE